MKNYIIKLVSIFILGMMSINIIGQNSMGTNDDFGKIVIRAYVSPQIEGLSPAVKNMLKNKMDQIVLNNGIGGISDDNRFIITPNITILTKNVISSAPPTFVYTLDVSFYIGDGSSGNLFAETSLQVKGVGRNVTKAYINAINHINPRNMKLLNLVEQGKKKIIQYYNTNCNFIQTTAKVLAQKREYDKAIYNLIQVPEVCKDCYVSSQKLSVKIYNMKMEYDCTKNIQAAEVAKANNEWNAAAEYLASVPPGVSCYKKAMTMLKGIEDHRYSDAIAKARSAWAVRDYKMAAKFLGEVPAGSKYATEAKRLYTEISTKMDYNEKRDWKLLYEQYNRAQTYKETKGYELQKAQIKAARDVGVAYGKNQPETVYKTNGWW